MRKRLITQSKGTILRRSLISLCCALALLGGCATQPSNPGYSINQTNRGVEIQSSNTLLFDTGKADIKAQGYAFLDQIAVLLKSKTRNNVMIEGYTDNVGSVQFNQDLSELRALSVMKALVDRGVAKQRIQAVGYGMTHPVASNANEQGRQLNRRTVILILGEKRENLGNNPLGNLLQSIQNIFK